MRSRADLTGKRFGNLTAISLKPGAGRSKWECICDCGSSCEILAYSLMKGHSKSCKCRRVEVSSKLNLKHGLSKTTVYNVWSGIKQRTTNPKCKEYKWYGARGITMHKEWSDSFEAFYKDVGDLPFEKATLDRFDNSKGYFPGNCRWVTMVVQNNNRRSNKLISAFGETKTIAEWARSTGIGAPTISARMRLGWPGEDAVSMPTSPLARETRKNSASPNER